MNDRGRCQKAQKAANIWLNEDFELKPESKARASKLNFLFSITKPLTGKGRYHQHFKIVGG